MRIVDDVTSAGLEEMGERLVFRVLEAWDAPGGRERFRLVFAAASSDGTGRLVRDFLSREVLQRVGARLTGPDVPLRMNLVASQVAGLLVARHVLGLEPLASTPAAELARRAGAAVQQYLRA